MPSLAIPSLANVCALNDWDISSSLYEPGQCRRFGTVEFMAVSHLTARASRLTARARSHPSTIHHLYRHDLEALIWVLVWTISCYADGEKIHAYPPMFSEWDANKPTLCGITKGAFLFSGTRVTPTAVSWEAEVRLADYFLIHLVEICAAASIRARLAQAVSLTGMAEPGSGEVPCEADEPGQIWAKVWSNIHRFEKLRYILPYIPKVLPAMP
ncbi:uncharacterized protein SCHCODRAFT_02619732 [Schizophyllum commune H4-8]|nr:uncharacterized protein SCHCODRAFT_02619732 [Schizophyllum commune H4-8]KAI5895548.1 hypothetical protein SCHCODRAFT_02619732 [Schizophyllum commune H4-8]